jgi:hypothetical protein
MQHVGQMMMDSRRDDMQEIGKRANSGKCLAFKHSENFDFDMMARMATEEPPVPKDVPPAGILMGAIFRCGNSVRFGI